MRQRSCAAQLAAVHPSLALSCAATLPKESLSALLSALVQIVDESVLLSLRNPHTGSLPAASALQLLGEVLTKATGERAVPGATAAGVERCQRVLATHNCPLPVRHAAGRTLALLRPGMPPQTQTQTQFQAQGQARDPRWQVPFPQQQQQAGSPWQPAQQPGPTPPQRRHQSLEFPPHI